MDRERAKDYKSEKSSDEVYSTTGNNVDKIIAARKELYRTLLEKFPFRREF